LVAPQPRKWHPRGRGGGEEARLLEGNEQAGGEALHQPWPATTAVPRPYANYGEGSSASRHQPRSLFPLSNEDAFKPEADVSVVKVFGPEDFVHDDEDERRAMELARLESEAAAAATRQAEKVEQCATIRLWWHSRRRSGRTSFAA
jgi:hypothetical protein